MNLNNAQKESLKQVMEVMEATQRAMSPREPLSLGTYLPFLSMTVGQQFFLTHRSIHFAGQSRRKQTEEMVAHIHEKLDELGYPNFSTTGGHITTIYIFNDATIIGVLEIKELNSATTSVLNTKMAFVKSQGEDIVDHIESLKESSVVRPIDRLVSDPRTGGLTRQVATVTLSDKTPQRSFYPSFDATPEEMWDQFTASDSNVMVLFGPPGTGKTSFIRQMMDYRNWKDVIVADDTMVLNNPDICNAIRKAPEGGVFIIEDADVIVGKRTDGNNAMTALLNTTEGLIKTDTKFIISTNLPTLNTVDEALIRPGRTFRTLEFRPLTFEEARQVRIDLDLPVDHMSEAKKDWTLSEAINLDDVAEDSRKGVLSFGFRQ